MNVAPFESCVACYRADTDTGLALRGEAEFGAAFLHAKLGLPMEDALGTIQVFAERESGCEPGIVPGGRFDLAIRLCRSCAEKAGVSVGEIRSGQLPGYAQGDAEA
jgi:hypothetical protein